MKKFGTNEYGNAEGFRILCNKCGKEARILPARYYKGNDYKNPCNITLELRCSCGNVYGATIHSCEKDVPCEAKTETKKENTYDAKIKKIEELMKKYNASYESSLYDENHTNCFWYDGNSMFKVNYKKYSIHFDVCGDISIAVYGDDTKEPACFRHKGGGRPFFENSEIMDVIKDDAVLIDKTRNGDIVFENNNWINIIVIDDTTGEYVSEPEVADDNDILQAVILSLDEYIKYIDGFENSCYECRTLSYDENNVPVVQEFIYASASNNVTKEDVFAYCREVATLDFEDVVFIKIPKEEMAEFFDDITKIPKI